MKLTRTFLLRFAGFLCATNPNGTMGQQLSSLFSHNKWARDAVSIRSVPAVLPVSSLCIYSVASWNASICVGGTFVSIRTVKIVSKIIRQHNVTHYRLLRHKKHCL
jgi:hypothetical protein